MIIPLVFKELLFFFRLVSDQDLLLAASQIGISEMASGIKKWNRNISIEKHKL